MFVILYHIRNDEIIDYIVNKVYSYLQKPT